MVSETKLEERQLFGQENVASLSRQFVYVTHEPMPPRAEFEIPGQQQLLGRFPKLASKIPIHFGSEESA
jgi:hypothetical protein